MRIRDNAKLLLRNRFRVHPQRYAMVCLVGATAVTNSSLALMQRLLWQRRIQQTKIESPVFVVGHWRSGTTLLHELMALDDQFAYPTTYQCFVPHHFLVSSSFLRPIMQWLLPRKRPMDDMPAGTDLPQEDEFALLSMGAPTPYYQLAFCNDGPVGMELFDLDDASTEQKQQLRDWLTYFYKAVSLKKNKPLILKSPTHTGRIAYLSEWFPNARFIHITRHPYKIFPSTMHLWRSLYQVQSYQLPKLSDAELTQYVLNCFERMYDGYFTQVDQVPAKNLIEVRFEDLVENPVAQLWKIYDAFDLGDFERVQGRVEEYLNKRKGYQPNETQLRDDLKAEIDERWARYIQRYNYEMLPVS